MGAAAGLDDRERPVALPAAFGIAERDPGIGDGGDGAEGGERGILPGLDEGGQHRDHAAGPRFLDQPPHGGGAEVRHAAAHDRRDRVHHHGIGAMRLDQRENLGQRLLRPLPPRLHADEPQGAGGPVRR